MTGVLVEGEHGAQERRVPAEHLNRVRAVDTGRVLQELHEEHGREHTEDQVKRAAVTDFAKLIGRHLVPKILDDHEERREPDKERHDAEESMNPHHHRNTVQRELRPVIERLGERDIERVRGIKRDVSEDKSRNQEPLHKGPRGDRGKLNLLSLRHKAMRFSE